MRSFSFTTVRLVMLAAMLAAVLTVTACGGSGDTGGTGATAPADQTPATGTADEGAAPTDLDGEALVQQKCTMCHSLEQATGEDRDAAGWSAIVDRMVKNGLVVTDEEKATIIDYLAATYGK